MSKIVTAVVGCGRLANNVHLPNLSKNPDVELRYAVDIIEERAKAAAEQYGMKGYYTDYRKIFEDKEVRAVMVITSNYAHYEITVDCLNHGLDVFCEKPMTVNYELSKKMAEAAHASGRTLEIGVCNRYNRTVEIIRDKIASGELGTVYGVYCSFRSFRSIPGLGGEFTTKAISGGGALIDWGVHFIDLIFFCIAEPAVRTVSAATYCKLADPMENYTYTDMWAGPPDYSGTCDVEEFVTGLVRTEGPTISMNGAWAQNIGERQMYIEFLGTKAGIKLDYGGNFVLYSTKNGMLTETKFDYPTQNMYEVEIRDFLLKAPQGIKTKGNIDHAILSSRLMDMIYKSAELGEEVKA